MRFHFEPKGLPSPPAEKDLKWKAELLDELTGDVEFTTSGHGLAGAYGTAPLKDAAKVEAFVKRTCEETGATNRKLGLEHVTVDAHGCSGAFNPHLWLLPIAMGSAAARGPPCATASSS